jgi:hypothetical protein
MGFPSRLSALDPVLGPGRQCRLPVRGLCRARCRHRHAANQPHRRVLAEPGGHQPVDLRAARCLEERAPWAGHNQVFRPVTEGAQHVRDKGAAIIASNHLSFADWFFIPLALDRRITFVAKSDHFARGLSGAPVIPSAIIGIDIIAPPGKIITKIVSPTMKFGEPLDFSRYEGMSEDRFILRTITDVIMYAIMELSGQEYVDIYAPAAKEAAAAKLRQGRPTRCLLRPERYLDASRAGRPQADDDCAIRGSKGVGEGYSQRRERNRRNQGLRPWTASWCWPWGVCGRHRSAPTAGLASLAVLPAECQFERQPDCRRSVPRRRVARGSGRCAVVMASGWRTAVNGRWTALIAAMVAGWGSFDVVEGLVDHYLLNLHHVRPGPNQAAYDIAFLIFGVLLAIGGFAWYKRTTASARASSPEPAPR